MEVYFPLTFCIFLLASISDGFLQRSFRQDEEGMAIEMIRRSLDTFLKAQDKIDTKMDKLWNFKFRSIERLYRDLDNILDTGLIDERHEEPPIDEPIEPQRRRSSHRPRDDLGQRFDHRYDQSVYPPSGPSQPDRRLDVNGHYRDPEISGAQRSPPMPASSWKSSQGFARRPQTAALSNYANRHVSEMGRITSTGRSNFVSGHINGAPEQKREPRLDLDVAQGSSSHSSGSPPAQHGPSGTNLDASKNPVSAQRSSRRRDQTNRHAGMVSTDQNTDRTGGAGQKALKGRHRSPEINGAVAGPVQTDNSGVRISGRGSKGRWTEKPERNGLRSQKANGTDVKTGNIKRKHLSGNDFGTKSTASTGVNEAKINSSKRVSPKPMKTPATYPAP